MTLPGWLTSVLLRPQFALRMQGFHDLHPHPGDGVGFEVEGPDAVRVVLVGAGIGVGYGVRATGLALSGQLARTLADTLDRGVVVDNRTEQAATLRETVQLLDEQQIADADAVVYLPTFIEATHGATRRWLRRLNELLTRVRTKAAWPVPIVLTGLPLPSANGFLEHIARPLVIAQNTVMAQLAAADPATAYVAVAGIATLRGGPVFDTAYYQQCAEAITQQLARLPPHRTATPRERTARSRNPT